MMKNVTQIEIVPCPPEQKQRNALLQIAGALSPIKFEVKPGSFTIRVGLPLVTLLSHTFGDRLAVDAIRTEAGDASVTFASVNEP